MNGCPLNDPELTEYTSTGRNCELKATQSLRHALNGVCKAFLFGTGVKMLNDVHAEAQTLAEEVFH